MGWFLIQARLGSTRLPNKVLMNFWDDLTLLEFVYKRVLLSKYANNANVVVLIPDNKENDALAKFLKELKILYYRGDEQDVFKRFRSFLIHNKVEKKDFFLRICSDNPFIDPYFIDNMIAKFNSNQQLDYISYISKNGKVAVQNKYGFFGELVNIGTFLDLKPLQSNYTKENVTPVFYQELIDQFKLYLFEIPQIIELENLQFSIDTLPDFQNAQNYIEIIGKLDFKHFELYE